eukprot:COSAG02_NODE_2649_length_8330_cov_8.513605_2_plen_86_part_00
MNRKARQSGEQYVQVVHYGSHAVTSPEFPNESVNQSSGSRLSEYCTVFLSDFSVLKSCSDVHNGSLFIKGHPSCTPPPPRGGQGI